MPVLSPTRITLPALIGIALLAPSGVQGQGLDRNPCLDRETRSRLFCPDLQMSPPEGPLFVSRSKSGRVRLHAGNSINSLGAGPAELRGRRATRWTMNARQAIYRRGGGVRMLDTGARLGFKAIPGQYRYWKFIHAAKFELWRLDKRGRRVELARTGPKISYCLRDLQRRYPDQPNSPSAFHYPACSQDFTIRRVTLGTSVGWSDVYPSTYHEQWIYVDRLKGCFAFRHVADPKNGIYESNERNNVGERIIRLPWRGPARQGCPKRSTGVRPQPEPETGPDGGAEAP